MKKFAFILQLVILISCDSSEEFTVAESFVNEVLDIMENNSIHRKTIDWVVFRNQVTDITGSAQTIEDTYIGLTEALKMLGDNYHSRIRTANGQTIRGGTLNCNAESFQDPSIPANIGYVNVGSFSGSGEEAIKFAEDIQNQIKLNDSVDLIGWIVDLRGNGGGNMWPMIAGVGPVLGEGIIGYFIDPDDNQQRWDYTNGSSTINDFPQTTVPNPYQLINPNPKVAVLIDKKVGSSGEAVVISFIGRDNTRSFGTSTCGLSTANQNYNLSNGDLLLLTVAYMADRNLVKYGESVIPDEVIDTGSVVERAIEWLEN